MPRPPNIVPGESRKVYMSTQLWGQIDVILYSPLEGKVPYGALKEFMEAAVEHYLTKLRGINSGRAEAES